MNSVLKPRQCANSVIVARPHYFKFNSETAGDNLFQNIVMWKFEILKIKLCTNLIGVSPL